MQQAATVWRTMTRWWYLEKSSASSAENTRGDATALRGIARMILRSQMGDGRGIRGDDQPRADKRAMFFAALISLDF